MGQSNESRETPYDAAVSRLTGEIRESVVRTLAEMVGCYGTAPGIRDRIWDLIEAFHVTSAELCAQGLRHERMVDFAQKTLRFRQDRKRWIDDSLF